jgi:hypothetical protein
MIPFHPRQDTSNVIHVTRNLLEEGHTKVSDAELVGKRLFGRPMRLRLGVWIVRRDKPRFFQSEPPGQLGSSTAIRQELQKFVELGLLEEERPDGENRVYYVRTESAWWAIFATCAEILERLE